MNRYDKETTIIRDFQSMPIFKIKVLSRNIKIFKIFWSIYNEKKWKDWIDTSAKNQLPPDFYNEKLKVMMDVMRVDDHAYVDKNGNIQNPCNKRESELTEELIKNNPSIKKIADDGNLFLIPNTGLKSEDDHNYKFYINNFKRVIKKHIDKIVKYKQNHPKYEIIFFVADESTSYIKRNNKLPRILDQSEKAEIHYWWLDKELINNLKDSGIDYLIWFTPYKKIIFKRKIASIIANLPKIVIIDVKKIKYNRLLIYDKNEMSSAEL